MRALAIIMLTFMSTAASAQTARPWTYDVYGPGGNYARPIARPGLPTLPGQPIRRFAENWQEILCWFTAYSVSPTLPPAQQKLYLGNCPPRWELERGPPGSGIIGGIRPKG